MTLPKILMLAGLGLFLLGLILNTSPNLFAWFGKLPGDIRIEKEHSFIFFPITSMIVVSLVLSVLFNLFFRK
jgi:hypothetical protein